MNITDGIPSEIYVAIGRDRYDDEYEVARETAAAVRSEMAAELAAEKALRHDAVTAYAKLEADWRAEKALREAAERERDEARAQHDAFRSAVDEWSERVEGKLNDALPGVRSPDERLAAAEARESLFVARAKETATTSCTDGVWWATCKNGGLYGPRATERGVLLEVAEMRHVFAEERAAGLEAAMSADPIDRREAKEAIEDKLRFHRESLEKLKARHTVHESHVMHAEGVVNGLEVALAALDKLEAEGRKLLDDGDGR